MQALRRRPHVEVRGLPGPTWSMALWAALFAVVALGNRLGLGGLTRLWLVEVVVEIAIVVALLLWPRTRRDWLPRTCLLAQLGLVFGVMLTNVRPVDQLATALVCIVAVVYAGIWWAGWMHYAIAALGSLMYLAVVVLSAPDIYLLNVWFTFTAVLTGTALGVHVAVGGISHRASLDPLTGALNRGALQDLLATGDAAPDVRSPRTVILFDLDGFKQLNDRSGHAAGDDILRECAAHWREHLGPADVMFRIGGDEFLLMVNCDGRTAARLVDRMRRDSPFAWSAGVAEWRRGASFEDTVADADRLLYESKAARRPR